MAAMFGPGAVSPDAGAAITGETGGALDASAAAASVCADGVALATDPALIGGTGNEGGGESAALGGFSAAAGGALTLAADSAGETGAAGGEFATSGVGAGCDAITGAGGGGGTGLTNANGWRDVALRLISTSVVLISPSRLMVTEYLPMGSLIASGVSPLNFC